MHGETVGACKNGIEIIVTIIFTECFLNTVADIPLSTLPSHILFRERGVASAGKMTELKIRRKYN